MTAAAYDEAADGADYGAGTDALVAESAAIIRAGSQSFAAASRLFDPRTRAGAHLLYAWCRHCDDVVDGQELGRSQGAQALTAADRRARVEALERATHRALASDPQGEAPVFRGLRQVAVLAGMDPRWPTEHLAGFHMDIDPQPYPDLEALLVYCWRVAGVVGVMMAQVMGVPSGSQGVLRRAQDLGLAFQLTNIARDVVEDARNGRVYLPADWLAAAGIAATPAAILDPANREGVARTSARLVAAAEPFYDSAAAGLTALPFRSAWAIAVARGVYRAIGRKVVAQGPLALDARVSTSKAKKAWHAAGGLALALASRRPMRPKPRPQLWSAI